MERALYDPVDGYYRQAGHPAGLKRDYATGSSLHPAFAECIADFVKKNIPRGRSLLFADTGCGSGTFLANLSLQLADEWSLVGVDSHLPENLPPDARHLESVENLPDVEGIIFSYELFDALPCHLMQFTGDRWRELYVEENKEGFQYFPGAPSDPSLLEYIERFKISGSEGRIVEVCPEAEQLYRQMAERQRSGYMITFDYGRSADLLYRPGIFPGGTLMAYREQKMHRDILKDPGKQDITYAVNFTALEEAGLSAGLKTVSFSTQSIFLLENGFQEAYHALEDEHKKALVYSLAFGSMGQDLRVLVQRRA